MLAWLALTVANADPLEVRATVHTLPNGLTVVLEEDHRTDKVALHIHYGVGARDEQPGELGCAHLFEHVMFEGSRNVPQNKFDEWLTAAGGENNAYTSEDETAYHETFPSGATDVALFLESDRMGFLLDGLTEDNLANQRLVVLQERAEGYAEPHGRDWDALTRLSFAPDHPYHHPVIGTISDVEGFTVAGTSDFWRRHYRPRNAVMGVVGNFDTADMIARIEHWFSDVPDPGPAGPRAAAPSTPPAPADGVVYDAVESRTVYVAWRSVPLGHPDEPALDLLSWVLSGGRGTRLDDALYYEKSIAYDVGVWSYMSELEGQFVAYVESDRTPEDLVARVEKVVAKLEKAPPTADELDRARRAMRAGILDGLEAPEDRVGALVDCQRRHGTPDCLGTDWARYEAVTTDDLLRVAQTYLVPERRVTLSVLPEGDDALIDGAVAVELP
jgi:zinc protease